MMMQAHDWRSSGPTPGYLRDRLFPTLSGGEQQRVQIARVLAQVHELGDGLLVPRRTDVGA